MVHFSDPRLVCMAAAVWLVAASAEAQTSLQWRLAPGEQFSVTVSQSSATEAEIGGRMFTSSLNVGALLKWRVAEVADDGTALIEQTVSRLTVTADFPGADRVTFDSASQDKREQTEAENAVADEFRALVGETVELRLTPRGEIREAAPASHVAEERGERGKSDAGLSMPDVRQMLGRLLPPLPPGAVSPGDAWSASHTMQTPQSDVRISGEYRYGGVELHDRQPRAKIEATYRLHAEPEERGVTLELQDQDATGVFFFDVQNGRLTRGAISQKFTMRLNVEGAHVAQKLSSKMQIEFQPVER